MYKVFDHDKIDLDKNLSAFCGCPSRVPGVTQPTEINVNGKWYLLYTCPDHYIPDCIWDWYQEYKYYRTYQNAAMPPYEDLNPKWFLYAKAYEQYLRENQKMIEENYA